ncbi:hypothetical protein [Faecalibacter macacae]|uniref:Uncharacterized protein n=1 Tax=Faecalibacter macacae TaxID=1859289 RepID=A0A3L9MCZ2_9FLAO|nr:hypothetical protein [Faecalibacter macacae]RLZ10701.1 hypothetical protein EAH69_06030 [Faecalibacter macacae]
MAKKVFQKKNKLEEILYGADNCQKLRWSPSTLKRRVKSGLPHYLEDKDNPFSTKYFIEEEVVNWLLRHKSGYKNPSFLFICK